MNIHDALFEPRIVRRRNHRFVPETRSRHQARNPVMFVVLVGSILTTALWCPGAVGHGEAPAGFILAHQRLAVVHGAVRQLCRGDGRRRGKAQADTLREEPARRHGQKTGRARRTDRAFTVCRASALRKGDVVLVEAGDFIPMDGEVIEGAASVDESAITGESAPVIRESGGDRSQRDGRHASALRLARRARHGRSRRELSRAHDRDGRGRQAPEDAERNRAQHPAGGADDYFSAGDRDTAAVLDLRRNEAGTGSPVTVTVLVALLVCLIPTTIGALLSAIGIAGMDRMLQANVIAMSGRAVEAAGDVDVLLLDKTGTITLGNRQATAFIPADGVLASVSSPTRHSSPRWPTRLRKAAASSCWRRSSIRSASAISTAWALTLFPFTAQHADERSGPERTADPQRRRGCDRARTSRALGGRFPASMQSSRGTIARQGGTPLVVADGIRPCSASSS